VVEKRLPDSPSRGVGDSPTRRVGGVADSPTRRVGESAFECLKENLARRRVGDSPTHRFSKK
jgi:hypothetical protein